jgi:hypothetical protein
MMLLQVNAVSLAKITKAVGFMAGTTSSHSRAGTKLREPKALFETLVFVRDKPVVEIDAMRDKYPALHELHEVCWASASSESANNGTLEVRTVTNNDDSYAAQAEAGLSYTFRLDSTPGAPGASLIPLHVIASGESLRDTNFADEKATIEIDQGGSRLAYAEQKILSGREIDLLSLNQTIDVAPDTDIVVTMFASSNIISFAGNGRRSSGVLLDPLFDIAPEYASLYTLVGLPEGTASAAVPEPTTWAMMVVGFAGLGFAGYRTSRRADAAAG